MTRAQIPITPAVLTWARQRAGYTLEEAKRDFRHIEAWESGEAFPTYPQLEKLADKYGAPIAVLFWPEPPEIEPIETSFRTLPEPQFERLPKRMKALLRKAKGLQIGLAELNDGRNPADRLIARDLSFPIHARLDDIADKVRSYLGISLEAQMGWESIDKALENWRYSLGDVGIFVFKDAFLEADYSGFCLYDKEFPIVYINNTTAKSRQIFTLFHELAHLLFRTSGVDKIRDDYIDALKGDARNIEILCNRFAAKFLVPSDAFDREFRGRKASRETAALLAERFNVSREVIYRMFLDRRFIGRAEYEAGADAFSADKKSGQGGDYYNNQIAYLGLRYIGLAFRQYYANRIDEDQLADYLNIAPRNIPAFEEKYLRKSV